MLWLWSPIVYACIVYTPTPSEGFPRTCVSRWPPGPDSTKGLIGRTLKYDLFIDCKQDILLWLPVPQLIIYRISVLALPCGFRTGVFAGVCRSTLNAKHRGALSSSACNTRSFLSPLADFSWEYLGSRGLNKFFACNCSAIRLHLSRKRALLSFKWLQKKGDIKDHLCCIVTTIIVQLASYAFSGEWRVLLLAF